MGHTASTLSQDMMHSLWNMWLQLRWITGWPASYSQKQIAQQSAQETGAVVWERGRWRIEGWQTHGVEGSTVVLTPIC